MAGIDDMKPAKASSMVKPLDLAWQRWFNQVMHILLNVSIPHEDFNAAVRDGSVGQKLKRILDDLKPEAAYFTEMHGGRGVVLVVDLPDPSKIPALAEPWFLTFRANVEFKVIMSPMELANAGLEELGKKWA